MTEIKPKGRYKWLKWLRLSSSLEYSWRIKLLMDYYLSMNVSLGDLIKDVLLYFSKLIWSCKSKAVVTENVASDQKTGSLAILGKPSFEVPLFYPICKYWKIKYYWYNCFLKIYGPLDGQFIFIYMCVCVCMCVWYVYLYSYM